MKRFLVVFFILVTAVGLLGKVQKADYELMLGDIGRPGDYEQTTLDFAEYIPDFKGFARQLPNSFDWSKTGKVTPAKAQGSCGSCWAFTAVGALESKILILDSKTYDLSEQQQISCNNEMQGCSGGNMTALRYWYYEQPMGEECTGYYAEKIPCGNISHCPRVPYNTTGYYTVTMTESDIKTSLYNDGPGYFRFDVYEDFINFWDNGSPGEVYRHQTGNHKGGHAVLIIGWDNDKSAWKCKNSWGRNAGPNQDGTFWIAYSGHSPSLNFGMANVRLSNRQLYQERLDRLNKKS